MENITEMSLEEAHAYLKKLCLELDELRIRIQRDKAAIKRYQFLIRKITQQ